jgi:hypothetical protein
MQHRQYLMSFGFTPADRSRIASMAPAGEEDKFDFLK